MALTKIKSYKSNFKKCKDVLLADNIFFTAYKRWNGEEVGTDIIKGMLPADEKKALHICNNGIIPLVPQKIKSIAAENVKFSAAMRCKVQFSAPAITAAAPAENAARRRLPCRKPFLSPVLPPCPRKASACGLYGGQSVRTLQHLHMDRPHSAARR